MSRLRLYTTIVQKYCVKIEPYLRHENKVNENKLLYYKVLRCETKKKLFFFMSNLQNYYHCKIDFQKKDQHTGGKWLIHGTKRHKAYFDIESLKCSSKNNSYSIVALHVHNSNVAQWILNICKYSAQHGFENSPSKYTLRPYHEGSPFGWCLHLGKVQPETRSWITGRGLTLWTPMIRVSFEGCLSGKIHIHGPHA